MNIKIIKNCVILLLLLSLCSWGEMKAEGGDKKNKSISKTTGTPSYRKFNINQISTFFKNDGESDINPTGDSGFEFPKGSNKHAVFQSGFLWGGKVNGQIRVGGSVYRQGTLPGKIINSGVPANQLIAEDPDADNVRMYRVRPDWETGSVLAEMNDGEGSEAEIRAAYERDWNEWPWEDGAPYDDVDSNGTYDPLVDIPGFPGADQTLWFVCNDVDPNQTQQMYGSLPMGVEEQVTVWGYNSAGPLGNMLFRKYKIINKSNTPFEDMYVSMWNDPDLGDAGDDLVGCDTTLSLAFCYNGSANDQIYGNRPPAVGFDFFQGPMVRGNAGEDVNNNGIDDASDYAIFDNDSVGPGFINLPMSAHYMFINPDPVWRDPTQGQYEGTVEWYNYFQGRIGTTGDPFRDPDGNVTKFALAGDPITGSGWVDGDLHPADDRRAGMVAGPFTMAPGDTQEVVVAEIVALGANYLASVSLLKNYDEVAQDAYDKFFQLPSAPPPPSVSVTGLDKEIVLNWGGNLQRIDQTESHTNPEGYSFQGYNVYQLPSPSDLEGAVRVATFDIVDEVTAIVDRVIDPQSGVEVTEVQQYGNDTGLKRFLSIKRDHINNTQLNNGSRYYFAVTAYSFNPDSVIVPNNLENPFTPITAIPQSADPGSRFSASSGDSIANVIHDGPGDGSVIPVVVDPSKLTGHTYRVGFEDIGGQIFWNVTNTNTNTVVASQQTNQSGNDEYPIVDGILIKVLGPPPGVKPSDMFATDDQTLWGWDIPSGERRFTWAGGADGFGWEGFRGAIGWGSPAGPNGFGFIDEEPVSASELKNVLLILGTVPDATDFENPGIDPDNPPNDENFSFAYRYLRGANADPARPEFAPYITPAEGLIYPFQDFKKSAPLSAWDIDDPANPRRLAVGFLENNGANGLVDGRYFPGNFNNYDNVAIDGPREWFFVYDTDYSETPNPDFQGDLIQDPLPIMYWLTVAGRGAAWSPGGTGEDQFAIFPNKINTANDTYTFSAPENTSDIELAKEDVERINVFPNPYYGVNPQEINKYERFVTFNHLPQTATIRIFNLSGQLIRTIEKNSQSQFERWDLLNEGGLPVASGLYIVYVEMPELGKTKILKAAIIQEQQILDRF